MTKEISKSPQRYTFQKEAYHNRCEESGMESSESYDELFDSIRQCAIDKWNDPANMIDNLEYDLLTTDWILAKVRASESYAQNLYAAICNREFIKKDMIPILMEKTWGCSWRSAGGIIADMRQSGDYIDWYCSGIGSDESGYGLSYKRGNGYVPESIVTAEIESDLNTLGWLVVPINED
jgi:hypothetical protein